MIEFAGEIIIERPAQEVFEFVADPANIPKYQSKVASTRIATDGPIRRGTRFDETVKLGPFTLAVACEIVTHEEPRRVAFTARGPVMHCDAEYELEAVPGGTRVRLSGRAQPQGWRRILQPLMRAEIRAGVQAELRQIRQCLVGRSQEVSRTNAGTASVMTMKDNGKVSFEGVGKRAR